MKNYQNYNWELSPKRPFLLMRQDFPTAQEYAVLDIHQALHLQYVFSGEMTGRIGAETLTLRAGDLALNAPWELHGHNRCGTGLRLFTVTADPKALADAMLCYPERFDILLLTPVPERQKIFRDPALRTRCGKLLEELNALTHEDPGFLQMYQWLLIQKIFGTLLEYVPPQQQLAENCRKLAPALSLFRPGTAVSAAQAAEICHLSVSRFSHLFHETCHISFASYQLNLRLSRAAARLKEGMSVKSAAAEENFYDTSYFVKCFRKKFGCSPGTWLRR